MRLKEVTHGVLLLRIAGLSKEDKLHVVESVLALLSVRLRVALL